MRTIKFRGKRVDNGRWVDGNLVKGYDATYIVYDAFNDDYRWGFENVFIPVVPESIGQFTGLLDKNGKEIYEGDLIKSVFFEDINDEVVWNQHYCQFTFGGAEFNVEIKPSDLEVMGNVHDNPELVTKKTE
jgi:uncharacterized phage protein (TIGR01671 family)